EDVFTWGTGGAAAAGLTVAVSTGSGGPASTDCVSVGWEARVVGVGLAVASPLVTVKVAVASRRVKRSTAVITCGPWSRPSCGALMWTVSVQESAPFWPSV